MKSLESDFSFENWKVESGMKKAFKYCNIGVHNEVTKCLAMLVSRLIDVRKVNGNNPPVFDALHNGKAVTDGVRNATEERERSPAAYVRYSFSYRSLA